MALDKIDPRRCAVLLLDFTTGVTDAYATNGRGAAAKALALSEAARKAGALNVFVIPGVIGIDGKASLMTGEPIDSLRPQDGDRLLYKSRIGAFTTTNLDVLLRQTGRDTLVVTGVATSGTVLSTTRQGFDLGYKVIVVEDACSDPEEAVHALLTTPVHKDSWVGLWRVAEIATTDQVVAALS